MSMSFKRTESKPSMAMTLSHCEINDIRTVDTDKDTTVSGVKLKKSRVSLYLKFFDTDGKSRRCKFCKRSYSVATATGNLGRHLKNHHPGYDQQADNSATTPQAYALPKKALTSAKPASMDSNHFNALLLKWLIGASHPLSVLEDDGLINLFKFLNSSVNLLLMENAHTLIYDAFRSMREDVKMCFEQVDCKICISLDFWTSYDKVPHMSVTAHWIDENWSLQKVLLDVVRTPYPHTGIEIYQSLLKILEMFDISHKILACTHDNSQNADLACSLLKDEYLVNLKVPFTHIQCAAQMLNLIIEDGLRSVKAAVAKIRECVIEMNASTEIALDFIELASSCQEGSWKFPLDVSMRWSGNYTMLNVAAKAHTAMDAVVMKHEKILGGNHLTSAEKMAVDRTHRYLEPFYKTTQDLCTSEHLTLGLVLFFMDNVVEIITACRESCYEQDWLKNAAVDMSNKALKYSNQVYNLNTYISAILDPRIKGELMPTDLNTDRNREATMNLFVMNYSSRHFPISNGYFRQDGYIGQENVEGSNPALSFAEEIARKRRRVSNDSATDELTQYLSEPLVSMATNVLNWWKANSTRYPRLSVMARDYLAIQPTSVEPHLLFSSMGDTAEKRRASMSYVDARAMVCIQSWLQSGFNLRTLTR